MTNVLLVTIDQWRADCLGVAGAPFARTPHLDALASEAVVFKRHYAGAAPCAPARACLLTGLYQMNNRVCVNGTPLDSRHDTIARAARRAGYQPTLFGYTDTAPDPRETPPGDPSLRTYEGVMPGFSVRVNLPSEEEHWLTWLRRRGVTVPREGRDVNLVDGKVADPPHDGTPAYDKDQTQTAFLVEEYSDWLDEQPEGRPWFAHVSFLRPHPPFVVPAPYNTMFDPDAMGDFVDPADWTDVAGRHPYLAYEFEHKAKHSFVYKAEGLVRDWTDSDLRQIKATYLGMVAEVDDQMGRLLAKVRDAGAWDDTIIVVTSDHGEMLGDHRLFGKFGFYDQSYHIPLIVRDPRAPEGFGRVVEHFTEAVDVTPTLLDLLGVAPENPQDGNSLRPFLEGETPDDWRTEAHWEFDFRTVASQRAETHFGITSEECGMAVMRDDLFKYVHFTGLPPLLFDLTADPEESVNVADDPAYAAVRIAYSEKMLAWRSRHLDQRLALTELTERGAVSVRRPVRSTPGEIIIADSGAAE